MSNFILFHSDGKTRELNDIVKIIHIHTYIFPKMKHSFLENVN